MGEPTLQTDIERLYTAGKELMPDAADRLSNLAGDVTGQLEVLNKQAALAGDPAILRTMLGVGSDVHDILRQGVISLNNAATAMIKTADDYRRTDQAARDDFNRLENDLRTEPQPRAAGVPPSLEKLEGAGAGTGDDSTPSTPDPDAPSEDAEQREQNEENSEFEHERQKRRG